MKDSSRSDSRRTGGGFRVASLARYAVCSFRGRMEEENGRENRRHVLHIGIELKVGPTKENWRRKKSSGQTVVLPVKIPLSAERGISF